ncbi:MAG TPA: 4Fe-4S double cluster binding domain-containing protein [candidate division Zixibacteria bacterium]
MTDKTTEELFLRLEEKGYKGRIVSIQHLRDLQEEIEGRYREGQFNEEFYQERLTSFVFNPPPDFLKAKSIIVVSVPQPQIQHIFNWRGETKSLIVPPTYSTYPNKEVEALLSKTLVPQGYKVTRTALPLKLLATRSGLGFYGKNNVCYVTGMGSFHRLMAFYSDLPCYEDNWQEAQMLETCENCSACLNNCPAGAISSERFLIHAERCITFHNEKPVNIPFPEWIDSSWHHCPVGCMQCQSICPENVDLMQWIEPGAEFSEDETMLLLKGVPLDQLPEATQQKIKNSDVDEYLEVLPRNLNILLNK